MKLNKLPVTESKKMEAEIREVFEAGCAAWNRGDLESYLAGYWDSEKTLWISGGSLIRGKEAILAAYKSRFSDARQMGKLTLAELEIDVLTPTDAFAFGRWMLLLENQSSTGFFTVQLKKREGTWFYVSDHSSIAKAARG